MSEKLGFVGLGHMGKWMAGNLQKAGFELMVYDLDPLAIKGLVDQGAKAARDLAHLAGQVDQVFLSLPNTSIVEEVLFGREGLIHGAREGLIVIDCGTTNYMPTLDFAKRLRGHGVLFADAPVSGMEARARDATLTIMFGGDLDLLERTGPALRAMGNEIVPMGDVGCGQLSKLVNQLLFNVSAAAIAEVFPMAVKLGLDPEKVLQVVVGGTGRSFAAEFFGQRILDGRFEEGYPLSDAYKDMISAAEVSAHAQIPLPLVQAAITTYQMALAEGYGHEGKGAMIKVFERILHVEFRKSASFVGNGGSGAQPADLSDVLPEGKV
jgi:3-hydroxyisobutyrate dehydrogenase-like beta-hydroxyacid dehydrogenase